MKKNYKFLILLLIICNTLYAGQKVQRLGTYNIRIATDNDTGSKSWNNRKAYVAKIIMDNGFDVAGLQEIANETQENDLRDLLGDYNLITWGRNSATTINGERVGIVFRKNNYTLLEQGHYFLSADPAQPLVSWDSNFSRITVYAKLKDNFSDEVFYFFSTHLDNGGTIARREGTRINVEKMQEIAEDYPCFIVGDFNAVLSETGVHFTMGAFYNDARNISQTAPVGFEGTYSNWLPNGSSTSRRIDYIYCGNANVLSYTTINEAYGRDVTPSDHYPVLVTCTLNNNIHKNNIYVSLEGSDMNNGTICSPVRNLQRAIDLAGNLDTIRVTQGLFYVADPKIISKDVSLTMNKTLTFIGGYDEEFNKADGYTTVSGDFLENDVYDDTGMVIDGNKDNSAHLFTVNAPYFIQLQNFIIEGSCSESDDKVQGGAVQAFGYGVKFANVFFRNNYSSGSGAAVYSSGKFVTQNCTFQNNVALNGGAVAIISSQWKADVLNSVFFANKAESGASVYITGVSEGYFYGNTFYENMSSKYGNLTVYNSETSSPFLFVNNTFANNKSISASGLLNKLYGGSALYLYQSEKTTYNWVNNTITGNICECKKADGSNGTNYFGSAVHVRGGTTIFYNNIIAGNYSSGSSAGDIYLEKVFSGISRYNLYTSSDNMNITASFSDILSGSKSSGFENLSRTLDGSISGDYFRSEVNNNGGPTPTVKLVSNSYNGENINVLTQKQLSENNLNLDLNGDGKISGSLLFDQRNYIRNISGGSSVGAVEFKSEDMGNSISASPESNKLFYYNDFIYNNTGTVLFFEIYDISGHKIKSGSIDCIPLYTGNLTPGIYTFTAKGVSRYISLKFIL